MRSNAQSVAKSAEHEDQGDLNELVSKLKKKLVQLKKKNEIIITESLESKNIYEEKIKNIEKKMNIQASELTAQYNKLESEKRKLEIELDNMEIENQRLVDNDSKIGDNKAAHYQTMK